MDFKDDSLKSIFDIGALLFLDLLDGIRIKNIKYRNTVLSILNILKGQNSYISCPGCSRRAFDIEKIVKEIKRKNVKNKKIAIMGCIVNGPGEMKKADLGIVGKSKGIVDVYKKNKIIFKNIKIEMAKKIILDFIS